MDTSNCVAIDFETDGLNPFVGHRPFSAAAAFADGKRMFWRNGDGSSLRPGQHSDLARLLADPTIDKVFHNAKFDWRMAEAAGFKVKGKIWDTMIFCHLLDGRQKLGLADVSIKYLPSDRRKVIQELEDWFNEHKIGKKERYERFGILPPDMLERRNVGDADLTLRIFHRVFDTVQKTFPFLLQQEHDLLPVVKKMEERGILADMPMVGQQRFEFTKMIDAVSVFFEDMLGIDYFNINSPVHQREALQNAGLYDSITERTPPSKKHPKGQPKMDDSVLRGMHHPVAHMLLLGKTAAKFRDTFLQQVIDNATLDADMRAILHANFNQLGTNTGRFSCSKPNLQNIPIEGDRRAQFTNEEAEEQYEMTGFRIAPHLKKCFAVRSGYCHIHSDKKQAEMAMLAHYTNDAKLIRFFEEGKSIHDEVTMELFGEYSKGLKTQAKRVVFGYQYGAGNARLAHTLSTTLAHAQQLRKRLTTVFPTLPRWRLNMDQEIKDRGYIQTIHGRRHYLGVNEAYMSVNRMCQGTVGDEIKSRMIALDSALTPLGCTILLNIHDDIGTEVPLEMRHKAAPIIHEVMHETSAKYRLGLPSSLDITYTSYADLKEIEDVHHLPEPE